MNTINVLWTGGLDSTYLVVKLAMMPNICIQPYYVIDTTRKSVAKELSAIKIISNLVRQHKDCKANLEDAKIISIENIKEDYIITNAWKKLNKQYTLGSQYDFLARFACQEGINLAVGVLFSDRGKVARSIDGNAQLVTINISGVDFLNIESSVCNDSTIVFKNILFPLFMYNKEKIDEWNELISMGCEDIARSTWFCHNPIFGMTCGQCNPCQDALHEGMAFRVSILGASLGVVRRVIRKMNALCRDFIRSKS